MSKKSLIFFTTVSVFLVITLGIDVFNILFKDIMPRETFTALVFIYAIINVVSGTLKDWEIYRSKK